MKCDWVLVSNVMLINHFNANPLILHALCANEGGRGMRPVNIMKEGARRVLLRNCLGELSESEAKGRI